MDRAESIEVWKREEEYPFSGWDFSHLDSKMIEDQAPWSYSARAAEWMLHSTSVIDLGTGGGERYLKLREYWPKKVVATEDYPPNLRLAKERLLPFGVSVFQVQLRDDVPMPFADAAFDLVLNRHSAFNPEDVSRILSPGGTFLTQQMHGLSGQDLKAVFDVEPQWPFATPEFYIPRLKSAGLTIMDCREWTGRLAFSDVGALVYYLKAVPWVVPGFSVETHLDYLFRLQDQVEENESLVFSQRRYLIEARKF